MRGKVMRYTIEVDIHELNIIKDSVKKEYPELREKENNRYLTDFQRDMIKDSKFKLLMLIGKLDNIIPVADKITV
jgi:hypothetical protein